MVITAWPFWQSEFISSWDSRWLQAWTSREDARLRSALDRDVDVLSACDETSAFESYYQAVTSRFSSVTRFSAVQSLREALRRRVPPVVEEFSGAQLDGGWQGRPPHGRPEARATDRRGVACERSAQGAR